MGLNANGGTATAPEGSTRLYWTLDCLGKKERERARGRERERARGKRESALTRVGKRERGN